MAPGTCRPVSLAYAAKFRDSERFLSQTKSGRSLRERRQSAPSVSAVRMRTRAHEHTELQLSRVVNAYSPRTTLGDVKAEGPRYNSKVEGSLD